jgi:hypothetical protein
MGAGGVDSTANKRAATQERGTGDQIWPEEDVIEGADGRIRLRVARAEGPRGATNEGDTTER